MFNIKTRKQLMAERRPEELKLINAAVSQVGSKQALARFLGLADSRNVRQWVSGEKPLPDKYLIQMMDMLNKNTRANE